MSPDRLGAENDGPRQHPHVAIIAQHLDVSALSRDHATSTELTGSRFRLGGAAGPAAEEVGPFQTVNTVWAVGVSVRV